MKTKPREMPAGSRAPDVVFVADLDANGVYWGVLEKHREDLIASDVEVPRDCDLAPGQYRWNASPCDADGTPQPSRFDPLPREKRRSVPGAPSMELAFAQLVEAMGDAAPAYVREWATWYRKTLDAR